MLTSVANVRLIPGLNLPALASDEWLYNLVHAADTSIKQWCKQRLEMEAYQEFYDGTGQVDVILRQRPVWSGLTTIAAGSNGVALPTSTINVASTVGFHPGQNGDSNVPAPTLSIQNGTTTQTLVTYTGTTATTFTGCTGGTGTLATDYQVGSPAIYFNPAGYYGQGQGGFADTSLLTQGNNYAVMVDGERVSHRGLVRRIGGNIGAWWGWGGGGYGQQTFQLGKLSAARLAGWPVGMGNIKACYTAGYAPDQIPPDLTYACQALTAVMIRTQPMGALLQSESLGAYSYSLLSDAENPELGSVRRILARYREVSWAN